MNTLLPPNTDYFHCMQYLQENPDTEGVDTTLSITLPRVPFLLVKENKWFCRRVFTMFFALPRIYDEIHRVVSLNVNMCPCRAFWIVENRKVPDPTPETPLLVMNMYRTYFVVEFESFTEKPYLALKHVILELQVRVYNLSMQKTLRAGMEFEEKRWYHDFSPYLTAKSYTLTLLDDLDARFFETDFYGIRRIQGPPYLHIMVATKPRRDLLYELLYGKFPFETLYITDTSKAYPCKLRFTLFTNET